MHLSQRTSFYVFIVTLLFLLAQAIWWFIFMEQLVKEKIELSEQLGATPQMIETIYEKERSQHRMIIYEGAVFFLILMGGLALVYRSLVQQQQLRKHQENFMMAVTHELKTPITSISVFLEGLKSKEIPESEKQTLIPKIKSDVIRLQKQIDNVLAAARAARLSTRSDYTYVNLSALVRERIDALGQLHFGDNYLLQTDIEQHIMFHGDRQDLSRAIDSILENAIIHNKGRKIVISVKLKASDNFITLEIVDNGIGIPKKEIDRIFDQFYRIGSELTRSTQGTGLGLYICRKIIKAHYGTVIATTDGLNNGVKFVVKFKRSK